MYKKNINTKHFSLGITFATFILIMSSLIVFNIIKQDNTKESINYSDIKSINPLVVSNKEHELDITSHNVKLAEEIKRVYSIDILYGDGTEYLAQTVDATAIYDDKDINQLLLGLIDCLEKYPSNIFKEIELKDYTVEICLVNEFNNDNLALATRDSNNKFMVYLANVDKTDKIKKTVHHETYHVLEYYMKLEYDINELYKDWNKYNPEEFEYVNDISLLNTKYVYDLDEQRHSYFVTPYAKVSEKEDRAETFADTMVRDTMPKYYIDDLGAIKNKMRLIANVLQTCFYSVEYSTSVYWTRYF